jgi:hypothetical protein
MNEKNGSENMKKETEPKVLVELANETGHVAMMMTKPETLKLVKQNTDHWIFMSGRLVDVADITEASWPEMAENNTTLQLTPGLVGGWDCIHYSRDCEECGGPIYVQQDDSNLTEGVWMLVDSPSVRALRGDCWELHDCNGWR